MTDRKEIGAVVLCGGMSRRMGFDKWKLPLGNQSLLECVLETLSQRVSRIVVSVGYRATSQPDIGNGLDIAIVEDQTPDCGPLEGIRCGLQFLSSECKYAFVTACDVPIFDPQILDFLLDKIGQHEAAIPADGDRKYAMTAVYQTNTHEKIARLVAKKELRVSNLADELDSTLISVEQLVALDPQLPFLSNINRPKEYFKLLKSRGLDCDPEIARLLLQDDGNRKPS